VTPMLIRSLKQNGMTMIELMVACLISLIFILAAGTGYLVNQKSYAANKEKLELQQQASHVMEIMEKNIRESGRVFIKNPPNGIVAFDVDSIQVTSFNVTTSGSVSKLRQGGAVLVRQDLINLQFIPNFDTTVVQINLTLQDEKKNKVAIRGSATLRNHPKLRAFDPGLN
jgi:prepilin-type N-terminal cleavage/methylation domain-containing protein